MRFLKFFALTSVAGLWALLFFSALIVSNTNLALFVQNQADIPGPYFDIGSARFSVGQNWLLRSYRPNKGESLRFYGIIPFQKKDNLAGRYLEFSVMSDEAEIIFSFMETDPVLNERLLSVLRGDLVPACPGNDCRVKKDLVAGLNGIVCPTDGGTITFLPDVGIHLVLDPSDEDPRKYLLLRKR